MAKRAKKSTATSKPGLIIHPYEPGDTECVRLAVSAEIREEWIKRVEESRGSFMAEELDQLKDGSIWFTGEENVDVALNTGVNAGGVPVEVCARAYSAAYARQG